MIATDAIELQILATATARVVDALENDRSNDVHYSTNSYAEKQTWSAHCGRWNGDARTNQRDALRSLAYAVRCELAKRMATMRAAALDLDDVLKAELVNVLDEQHRKDPT